MYLYRYTCIQHTIYAHMNTLVYDCVMSFTCFKYFLFPEIASNCNCRKVFFCPNTFYSHQIQSIRDAWDQEQYTSYRSKYRKKTYVKMKAIFGHISSYFVFFCILFFLLRNWKQNRHDNWSSISFTYIIKCNILHGAYYCKYLVLR